MQAPVLQPRLGTRMDFRQFRCRVNQGLVLLLEEQDHLLRLMRLLILTAQSSEKKPISRLLPSLIQVARIVAFASTGPTVNALCQIVAAPIAFEENQTDVSRQPWHPIKLKPGTLYTGSTLIFGKACTE
ncbi:hypothetical protein ACHAPV_001434 [Trichoderma viride]